jgi:hypothetical protein
MTYYSRYTTGKKDVALESRSYNKLHPSPKAYCFSMIDDQKFFRLSLLFEYSLGFHKYCLCIVHSQPSILRGLRPSSRYVVVVSQVLSYNHFTLAVFLYWPSLSSTLFCADSLQALSFWSHATSFNHPVLLSKRRSPPIASMVASV